MPTIANVLKGVWRLPLASPDAYGPYIEMSHHVGWNTVTSDINDAADGWHAASDAFFDSYCATTSQMSLVWNGVVEMRYYDLGTAGSPAVHMDSLGTYTRAAGSCPPPEQALVLTTWCSPYTGAGGPVTRRQSLQNRFFVGPLSQLAGTDALGRPGSTVRGRLITAYQAYMDVFDGLGIDANFPVVASPTNGSSSAVEGFWVDDDYDHQRRRGYDPTTYSGTRPS